VSAPDDVLERWARLLVGFGANVQPGQIVAVGAEPGKEPFVRAIAARPTRRARSSSTSPTSTCTSSGRGCSTPTRTRSSSCPSWYGERLLAIGDQRCARFGLSGPVEPGLFDDIDPALAGRDQLPFLKESAKVVNDRTTNWTIGPAPTPGWAALVLPDLAPADALAQLWEQLVHVLRLDEDDPVAAVARAGRHARRRPPRG
jgi:aminopeptidase